MTNTVGRVNFTAVLDGKGTPKDAENIGRKAGAAAGDGFDKEWSKSFRETLSESGQKAYDAWSKQGQRDGGVYGRELNKRLDSFLATARRNFQDLRLTPGFLDDFAKGFDDAGLAAGDLQRQLNALGESTNINASALAAAKRQVDEWAESQRSAAIATNDSLDADRAKAGALSELATELRQHDQAHKNYLRSLQVAVPLEREQVREWQDGNDALGRLRANIEKTSASTERMSFHWRDLSHNTRQWTLIIGAVLSGMQDIAVLGSAAGAGLLAVGGAATAGIAGVGGLAAVFVTLSKEIEDLPADLRPVKAEFDEFKGVFSDLRTEIARGAFGQMEGTFSSLNNTLRTLVPGFRELGESVGSVFDGFADGVRVGTDGFDEINRALKLAGPNFEALADGAGTWSLALVRAFNRANPLVQDFIGYIQRLGDRFDDFTRDDSFNDWVLRSQAVWGDFGELLDGLGNTLNDLVTPESVQRTRQFLDNLTEFMPSLTDLLRLLGGFDVFGIAANLLNELGRGFAPVAPAAIELAEALSRVAFIITDELGDALVGVSKFLVPVVTGLTDILNAVPESAWGGIANGVLLVAGAFVVLKGAVGVAGLVTSLTNVNALMGKIVASGDKVSKTIGGLGTAGVVGIAAAGFIGLTAAIAAFARELDDTDNKVRQLVATNASIKTSFDTLNGTAQGSMTSVRDWGQVLTDLSRVGNPFENFALAFSETGAQALALSGTLKELDGPIGQLAAQNLPAASAQFAAWATEVGASREQVLTLINQMPEFKAQLEAASIAQGGVATNSQLVRLALGESSTAIDENVGLLIDLQSNATLTGDEVDKLADKIRNFGSSTLDTRSAGREFEASLDDLNQSLIDNGVILDNTEAAGRLNNAAIDAAIQATNDYAASIFEQTGDQEAANQVLADGRQRLADMLGSFDNAGFAAGEYADELDLIPKDIETIVKADTTKAQNDINTFIANANRRTINIGVNANGNNAPIARAAGTMAMFAQHAIIGEAGPEAVVPLNRPLSQVDESVRWLSAIAQGKSVPNMASGGTGGGGRNVNISEGAIVVTGVEDPDAAANAVVRDIFERVGG